MSTSNSTIEADHLEPNWKEDLEIRAEMKINPKLKELSETKTKPSEFNKRTKKGKSLKKRSNLSFDTDQ